MNNKNSGEKTNEIRIGFHIIKIILANPATKVNRTKFLTDALKGEVPDSVLDKAIAEGTQAANIPLSIIQKAAKKCIKKTKRISTSESTLSGLPGGISGITIGILADINQFYGNLSILIQKLLYLYGAMDISNSDNKNFPAEVICIFMGIACGLKGVEDTAKIVLNSLKKEFIRDSEKFILFSKPLFYSAAKKVAKSIGIKITKKQWSKIAAKGVPIIGAGISGILNWVTFTPATNKLLNFFNVEYCKPIDQQLEILRKEVILSDETSNDEYDIDYENLSW